MKTCRTCGEVKDLSCFSKCSRTADGLQFKCKACHSAYNQLKKVERSAHAAEYYAANKDRFAEAGKVWREKNKERKAATSAARYARLKTEKTSQKQIVTAELETRYGKKILTRAQALKQGLVRYFTGKPCPHGHIDDRYTSTTDCVVCRRRMSDAWLSENPDKAQEYNARWVANNPEKYQAKIERQAPRKKKSNAERYEKNKDQRKKQILAWRSANPDKVRAIKHNYRAKEAAGGKHTAEDIACILKVQRGKCAYAWCRKSLKSGYHIDHVMPISRGGSNDKSNLQLLCPTCNLKKNAKHPIDFAQENGMLL